MVSSLPLCYNRSPIPPLLHNNDNVTASTQKAETFNAYFHSLITADNGSDVPMLRESSTFHPSLTLKFSTEVVYKELINLQCDKACDTDPSNTSYCQFGFQRKLSSVSLLLEGVNDWTKTVQNRNSTHCVFRSGKAFDSVSHPQN